MEKMQTLTFKNGKTYDITDDGAVRFDCEQNLTDPQQAQARENIGATTVEEVEAIVDAKLSSIIHAEGVVF